MLLNLLVIRVDVKGKNRNQLAHQLRLATKYPKDNCKNTFAPGKTISSITDRNNYYKKNCFFWIPVKYRISRIDKFGIISHYLSL
jgi:hypothetical protein